MTLAQIGLLKGLHVMDQTLRMGLLTPDTEE